MQHLTEAERAYRRGALQAMQYLVTDLHRLKPPLEVLEFIASWKKELERGRDSLDPCYLGKYLDEISRRFHQ